LKGGQHDDILKIKIQATSVQASEQTNTAGLLQSWKEK
jgi:hypothetical protein